MTAGGFRGISSVNHNSEQMDSERTTGLRVHSGRGVQFLVSLAGIYFGKRVQDLPFCLGDLEDNWNVREGFRKEMKSSLFSFLYLYGLPFHQEATRANRKLMRGSFSSCMGICAVRTGGD